jgi:hypothetical protein
VRRYVVQCLGLTNVCAPFPSAVVQGRIILTCSKQSGRVLVNWILRPLFLGWTGGGGEKQVTARGVVSLVRYHFKFQVVYIWLDRTCWSPSLGVLVSSCSLDWGLGSM